MGGISNLLVGGGELLGSCQFSNLDCYKFLHEENPKTINTVVKFGREDKIRLFSSRGGTNFYQRFLLEYCRHFGLWFRLRHSTTTMSSTDVGWIFLCFMLFS